jgi:hypothetical protein
MMIEAIHVIAESQLVARVRVERSEIIRWNDLLPHFEGKRYRTLGNMCLIDGEDWQRVGETESRLIEIVVAEHDPWGGHVEPGLQRERKRRGKTNGARK